MKHFGERLKELRLAFGYTQEGLADKIDFDRPNYVRIEGGYRTASDVLLEKLASLYGISLEQLQTEREALGIVQKYSPDAIKEAFKAVVPPEIFAKVEKIIETQGPERMLELVEEAKRRKNEKKNN
jgi:transcriptional regulator with XRE-family HTH domain